ncbi:LysR family transcriptional regulator [Photobacterium alginatilyticum]
MLFTNEFLLASNIFGFPIIDNPIYFELFVSLRLTVVMDTFSTIPVFTAVVELGSFSEASRQLGITKSAVSKRISALEAHLGVKLIQRTTRKLSLTEAGEQYYSYIQKAKVLVNEGEDAISSLQGSPKGHLKVSIPMVFGQRHIAPLLGEFLRRYPDIKLSLSLDDRLVDLVEEGVDMVLRIGALSDSNLIARKLSPCRSVVCASPGYLEINGTPETLAELKQHNCLYYSYFRAGMEWVFDGPNGLERIKPEGNIQVNNSEVLKQLMLDDVGICQMPLFLVESELASGELVPILEQYHLPEHGVYAVFPQKAFKPAKLKVFLDFLEQNLSLKNQSW